MILGLVEMININSHAIIPLDNLAFYKMISQRHDIENSQRFSIAL